jgi:hypothetical protein
MQSLIKKQQVIEKRAMRRACTLHVTRILQLLQIKPRKNTNTTPRTSVKMQEFSRLRNVRQKNHVHSNAANTSNHILTPVTETIENRSNLLEETIRNTRWIQE